MKHTPITKKRPTPRKWTCGLCHTKTTGKSCLECKTRKTTTRTGLKAKCDRLARELCRRLADGKCARCGGPGSDWAHRMVRRFHAVRWDMQNCDYLCRPCHQWFGDHPASFVAWLSTRVDVEDLERRANSVWNKDYLQVIRYLETYGA